MYNLQKDLEELTGIKGYNLNSLSNLCCDIIGHDVLENLYNQNNVTEINLGFGTLCVINIDNELKYKFIPCTRLETSIKNAYKNKSQIELEVNKVLGDRISKSYKGLF